MPELDLVFPAPVGRIHRAGAPTRTQNEAWKAFLRRLFYRNEQVELVLAFKHQQVSIYELLDADRRRALGSTLGDLKLRRPLWPTVEAVLPTMGRGAATRARYHRALLRLQRLGVLEQKATVADLRTVPWGEVLGDWDSSPSDWMHVRRALSHFLTKLLDDGSGEQVTIGRTSRPASTYHPARLAIMAAIPTIPEREREPDLPIETFMQIVSHFPVWLQPAPMTLAILGCRVGEYLDLTEMSLRPHTPAVQIVGSTDKKKSRLVPVYRNEKEGIDLWPWIEAGVPSPRRYKALRLAWVAACEAAGVIPGIAGVTVHDIRHCRAQWAIEAGSDLSAVQQTLGHRTLAMTARYARRKLKKGDAAVLGRLMAPLLKKGRRKHG